VRHGFWKKKAVLASRKFMEKNKTINARKKSGVALLGIIIMWLPENELATGFQEKNRLCKKQSTTNKKTCGFQKMNLGF